MKVLIPGPLLSYTGRSQVEACGSTMADLLGNLDRQFPGLRFRVVDEQGQMRSHIRFFINGEQVFDLGRSLQAGDSVQIVQALSGG